MTDTEKKNELQTPKEQSAPLGSIVDYPMDLPNFLPFRMFQIAMRMSGTGNKLSDLLKEFGSSIREREWRVLGVLGAYGGLTNKELVMITGMDAATITRAVKVLKKLDFIETLNSKRDRRKVLIILTEAGKTIHDQVAPKRIESGKVIDSCFYDDEKETLLYLLNKLDKHLDYLANHSENEWE